VRILERTSTLSFWVLAATSLVCSPVWGQTAAAPTVGVTGTGPVKTTVAGGLSSQTATVMNCENATDDKVIAKTCTDTAFVSNAVANPLSTFVSPNTFNGKTPAVIGPSAKTFVSAMDNALATQANLMKPVAGKPAWTVVYGGTLDVTIAASFSVQAGGNGAYRGGMNMFANITAYNPAGNSLGQGVTAPAANQLVWTQALYINYQPNSAATTPASPANTLDDFTFNTGGTGRAVPLTPAQKKAGVTPGPFNKAPTPLPATGKKAAYAVVPSNLAADPDDQLSYADPVYPFQNPAGAAGVNGFGDGPMGFYQTPASFRAVALLSSVNTTTDVITVFNDGVDYGFDLKTPEPSLRILSMLLSVLLFIAYRRRRNA
jgi:hypothetical protein